MSDPRRNAEGYLDVTAYLGTKNVINPAAIDDAIPVECMSYEEIMRIDLELLSTADYLVQLPGWERSIGASRELGFALGTDKIIVSLEQLLTKEVKLS